MSLAVGRSAAPWRTGAPERSSTSSVRGRTASRCQDRVRPPERIDQSRRAECDGPPANLELKHLKDLHRSSGSSAKLERCEIPFRGRSPPRTGHILQQRDCTRAVGYGRRARGRCSDGATWSDTQAPGRNGPAATRSGAHRTWRSPRHRWPSHTRATSRSPEISAGTASAKRSSS